MSRSFIVALLTIGPLAAGVCAFLLLVAGAIKLFSRDEQGLARLALDACLTIAAGAVLIIAIVYFALLTVHESRPARPTRPRAL